MLEIACNVSHSFGGFPRQRTNGCPSRTQPGSMKFCEHGMQRRDTEETWGHPALSQSADLQFVVQRVAYISPCFSYSSHVLCYLLLLQPTSPLTLQPLQKVEYQNLHFLSWTMFASGSWSVLQRPWSLCYWRPFSQKYWSSTVKNCLDLKGYWQRQDNHEHF